MHCCQPGMYGDRSTRTHNIALVIIPDRQLDLSSLSLLIRQVVLQRAAMKLLQLACHRISLHSNAASACERNIRISGADLKCTIGARVAT